MEKHYKPLHLRDRNWKITLRGSPGQQREVIYSGVTIALMTMVLRLGAVLHGGLVSQGLLLETSHSINLTQTTAGQAHEN